MRIIADKPIELLRALVNDHLPRVMPLGDDLAWVSNIRSQPPPEMLDLVEIPLELRTMPGDASAIKPMDWSTFPRIELTSLNSRIVLHGPESAGVQYEIVAALGPDIPNAPLLLLVTVDGGVVIATHTETAVHADGIVQLSGAEPSVYLATADQMRADHGKKLLRSGTGLRSLSLEHRGDDGVWRKVALSFDPDAIGLRELRLSDD